MSITGPQLRAARSILGKTQKEVAAAAEVSEPTVKRLEAQAGELSGHSATINAVTRSLEAAGVIFIAENGEGPGVRLRKAAGASATISEDNAYRDGGEAFRRERPIESCQYEDGTKLATAWRRGFEDEEKGE